MNRLLIMLSFFLVGGALSQGRTSAKVAFNVGRELDRPHILTIGDRLPDVAFDHMLNYAGGKARLSDFRAKLTILDFWSTACSACIALFPHMQDLQDRFHGAVKVVLVDGESSKWHDDSAKIGRAFRRLEKSNDVHIGLPIVYQCLALDSFVYANSLPHEVWLDESGRILAITGGDEVNDSNVRAVLDGKMLHVRLKRDVDLPFTQKPLPECLYENRIPIQPAYSSNFYKGWIDGISGYGVRRRDSAHPDLYTGCLYYDAALFDICKFAYGDDCSIPDNQMLLHVADPVAFVNTENSGTNTAWYDNSWSYDLTSPPVSLARLRNLIQDDLRRMFGISMKKDSAKLKCFVIKATDRVNRFFSKKDGEQIICTEWRSNRHFARGVPMKDVLTELNLRTTVPIIDSTGGIPPVDMDLPGDLRDTEALIACLKAVGFEVREDKRVFPVVIFKQE
jgi:thiol-disulfide isomerase/thioredoxin